ncbi:MAG: DUF2520 domain-containing protein [Micrococcaceae bacterium]
MSAPGRLKIGFVGAGKVGAVLAAALRAADHDIVGVSGSSPATLERIDTMLPGVPVMSIEDVVTHSELVFFTLPDDVLPEMVSGLAKLHVFKPGQLLAHTSGRHGAALFEPATGALGMAIHPAMTFTGTSLDIGRMVGCGFAVTAANTLLPIAQALVIEVGGNPQVVAEEDRPLYHAALAHASNHTATIIAQSSQMLAEVGIDNTGEYLGPLVHASIDNALNLGPTALTGPLVRGDVKTIAAHLEVLKPAEKQTYKALALSTLKRLQKQPFFFMPSETISQLEELLS